MPNLFPTIEYLAKVEVNRTRSVKFGISPRFDFDKGDFFISPLGATERLEGKDAWVEWCKKCLNTERYEYLIYSPNYGCEILSLLGKGFSRDITESEITRMVTEALKVDPRTNHVSNFRFFYIPDRRDSITFECEISSVQGDVIKAIWEVR